jgi:hypothetical protein
MRSDSRRAAALLVLGLAVLLVPTRPASAEATLTIQNADAAGEGFNDATPATPVGGNAGTTLGEQRRLAFQFAAEVWGKTLDSSVEIVIEARFDPLTCDATRAALGAAKAYTLVAEFTGAPRDNTWYPVALGNRLAGLDLAPAYPDISATFNSSLGTTCAFPNTWYYGLDGKPPVNRTDFVTTVVHELAHGLGFQTYVDPATGKKSTVVSGGVTYVWDDIFMTFLEDHSLGLTFPQMTDPQRKAACVDSGDLHWVGANVVAGGVLLTAGRSQPSGHVEMYAPNTVEIGSSLSHFAKTLTPNEALEPAYTGVNHNPGLARQLMQDVGWVTGAPTDLYFVVDMTGSFADDIGEFKTEAPKIIETLKNEGTDLKVGLGSFEDYPITPFGSAIYGDQAYRRNIDLTADTTSVLNVINGLGTRWGYDEPESQLAALYQAATGAGQAVADPYAAATIAPGQQAHFRDGAVKLFLLWTDAPFHRPGDPGDIPYPGPSFEDTVAAINALDPPKVIGVASGSYPGTLADLQAIAMATGGVAPAGGVDCNGDGTIDIAAGQPLVCATLITGKGVGDAMVAVVQAAQQPTAIGIVVRESINLKSALIPVTILGTEAFAPDREVAWRTVCLGRDATPGVGDCTESHGRSHVGDVNGDLRTDLVLHYDTKQTGILKGDTQVCVTGKTYTGTALRGCTTIRPVF